MLFAILAMVGYLAALHLGALAWIVPMRNGDHQTEVTPKVSLKVVWLVGLIACICHFINVSQHLIDQNGQNFTLANVASLMSLMMSLLVTLALPKWKTIWFPLSVIYILSIVCIGVSSFVSGSFIKQLAEDIGLLFHLAIALFSYALFFIALLYAFQLKWLDYRLKQKTMRFSPVLPPLMTVERHFFNLTLVAQGLLTIALISGMIYLHNFFAPEQIHKAIFSFMAWIVYNFLLLGQWKLHWRGNRVLIYSISGMMLLTIAYFGSRVL
ncbi:inner membrane protein YpjD [Muribacter muris]|uniref:Inner membrane protein YpjD n=1 Tax=Muribacter muris TaxID=67855 RepID=A0A4Y9K084_9PAST|nr:cytochrome c biogenesis protein CcsA [Muribacter muris]MBF0784767.1 cytochrome c biogenesis protein CcsA [Muribacter muris]MBF0827786.1 cytochrome c biogenesis protein CcsA [Muribacter muris]TFV11188.1 inner membrane protein YpjD [Muribacter muris]